MISADAVVRGALAVSNAAALLSWLVQFRGLVGSQGVLPAAKTVSRIIEATRGPAFVADLGVLLSLRFWRAHAEAVVSRYRVLPSFFVVVGADDWALEVSLYAGLLACLAILLGVAPALSAAAFALVWLSHLSVGKPWLSLQMDSKLVEANALFAATYAFRGYSPTLWVTALRWMSFRIMVACGAGKWTGRDASWRSLARPAMSWHYFTQPLPNALSRRAHSMPRAWHAFEVVATYVVEGLVPFGFFSASPLVRGLAFLATAGFNAAIGATGNYGHLHLLMTALSASLLADTYSCTESPALSPSSLRTLTGGLGSSLLWGWAALPLHCPAPSASFFEGAVNAAGAAAGWALFAAYAAVSLVPLSQTLEGIVELRVPLPPGLWDRLTSLYAAAARLHLVNYYSKFAHMTKFRWELQMEATADGGRTWHPFGYLAKPGGGREGLDAPPPTLLPGYRPTLDWRSWFIPLSLARTFRRFPGSPAPAVEPWHRALEEAVLRGSPPVLDLLILPAAIEGAIRAGQIDAVRTMVFDYRFTADGTRGKRVSGEPGGAQWESDDDEDDDEEVDVDEDGDDNGEEGEGEGKETRRGTAGEADESEAGRGPNEEERMATALPSVSIAGGASVNAGAAASPVPFLGVTGGAFRPTKGGASKGGFGAGNNSGGDSSGDPAAPAPSTASPSPSDVPLMSAATTTSAAVGGAAARATGAGASTGKPSLSFGPAEDGMDDEDGVGFGRSVARRLPTTTTTISGAAAAEAEGRKGGRAGGSGDGDGDDDDDDDDDEVSGRTAELIRSFIAVTKPVGAAQAPVTPAAAGAGGGNALPPFRTPMTSAIGGRGGDGEAEAEAGFPTQSVGGGRALRRRGIGGDAVRRTRFDDDDDDDNNNDGGDNKEDGEEPQGAEGAGGGLARRGGRARYPTTPGAPSAVAATAARAAAAAAAAGGEGGGGGVYGTSTATTPYPVRRKRGGGGRSAAMMPRTPGYAASSVVGTGLTPARSPMRAPPGGEDETLPEWHLAGSEWEVGAVWARRLVCSYDIVVRPSRTLVDAPLPPALGGGGSGGQKGTRGGGAADSAEGGVGAPTRLFGPGGTPPPGLLPGRPTSRLNFPGLDEDE